MPVSENAFFAMTFLFFGFFYADILYYSFHPIELREVSSFLKYIA